jgi:hypothetical protein
MDLCKILLICLPWIPAMVHSHSPQAGIAEKYQAKIDKAFAVNDQVRDIHPVLRKLYPIALVENKIIYIFEPDQAARKYRLAATVPDPYDLPKGIRAAMPLGFWNNRTACVVSSEIFDEADGYVMMFHEFVHCAQAEICEQKIKENLQIYQEAMKKKDYSWELQYPFPYGDDVFINAYGALLKALEEAQGNQVQALRAQLRDSLTKAQWEYMTWQQWKEGFARFVENRMRNRIGLAENKGGGKTPYSRTSFYYGGDMLIRFLASQDNTVMENIELLYSRIFGTQQ